MLVFSKFLMPTNYNKCNYSDQAMRRKLILFTMNINSETPFLLPPNLIPVPLFKPFKIKTTYHCIQNIRCTCSIHYFAILQESLVHAK